MHYQFLSPSFKSSAKYMAKQIGCEVEFVTYKVRKKTFDIAIYDLPNECADMISIPIISVSGLNGFGAKVKSSE